MRVAIPIWNGRVSPVMDTSRKIMLVDFDESERGKRQILDLSGQNPHEVTVMLESQEADVLICGAISAQLETQLRAMNIKVYPWICGNVELILAAFSRGALDNDELRLPGCRGRGRGRGRRRRYRVQRNMNKYRDDT
ncbi:MAG: dinitrogenase iron-molybdenum cofactor biosynthesis protein [candidate division Zixibacteria bacterium]|nr:dinitrogenase iron-molybdenum cofactor biosynthesis protein [candidate division Zixibacteria bacterium]